MKRNDVAGVFAASLLSLSATTPVFSGQEVRDARPFEIAPEVYQKYAQQPEPAPPPATSSLPRAVAPETAQAPPESRPSSISQAMPEPRPSEKKKQRASMKKKDTKQDRKSM